MEDMHTVIVLLSIIVGLLSVVILALLATVIMLLIKVRRIAQKIDAVTTNVARATEWLSPTKVFSEIRSLFHK